MKIPWKNEPHTQKCCNVASLNTQKDGNKKELCAVCNEHGTRVEIYQTEKEQKGLQFI